MLKAIYGLLAALFFACLANAASAQVVNGDFEAGASSWVTSGFGAVGFGGAHSGTIVSGTGCVGPTCMTIAGGSLIYQDVSTTPGASYTLTFWYRTSGAGDTPVELQALWSNGAAANGGAGTCTGDCVFGTTTASTTWIEVNRTVVATGPTMRIGFLGRNDPGGIYVDDVSLTALDTVPTMTQWAMALFTMMLAGFAALTVMRRRTLRA